MLSQLTTGYGTDHYARLLWTRDFRVDISLQEQSRIRQHIPGAPGTQASFKFSPSRCIIMPPGTPLCSYKRVCQDDLGGALQSGR